MILPGVLFNGGLAFLSLLSAALAAADLGNGLFPLLSLLLALVDFVGGFVLWCARRRAFGRAARPHFVLVAVSIFGVLGGLAVVEAFALAHSGVWLMAGVLFLPYAVALLFRAVGEGRHVGFLAACGTHLQQCQAFDREVFYPVGAYGRLAAEVAYEGHDAPVFSPLFSFQSDLSDWLLTEADKLNRKVTAARVIAFQAIPYAPPESVRALIVERLSRRLPACDWAEEARF